MILLNKKNSAYIEGKRPKPAINVEGYQCLANQIREQAKTSWEYNILIHEHITIMSIQILNRIIVILLLSTFLLYISIDTLIYLIFFLPKNLGVANILVNLGGSIFSLLVSCFLLSLLYDLYINYRTKVGLRIMQKLIEDGELISGHVETIHVMQRAKRKVTGKKSITIEYAFTTPEGELLRGTFATSKVKAVTSGDEVAVWYIKYSNKPLHILL